MTTRVVILGAGFGGINAALAFDREERVGLDVTLLDQNNFFLFTPMLAEVAASSIETLNIVNPIRRLFKRVRFVEAEIEGADLEARTVRVRLPTDQKQEIPYDHLIVALGSVPNYFGLPGVKESALPMKTIGDALALRNRSIRMLEEADITSPQEERVPLLTWVITGGGLAGVEVAAHLVDFLQEAIKAYPTIRPGDIRVVLVDALPRLMPELSPELADYTLRKLQERGVEVHLNATVESATPESVTIKGVGTIPTQNLVWTAGVAPTPLVQSFGIPLERGRIPTDQCLRVPGQPNVWALGDVARIPDGGGGYYPPTAQHAVREGRHVAKNVLRVSQGREPVPFRYRTLGMMASLGRRTGVAQILGRFTVSGFPAWWMWRTYYLLRLPRFEKRVRVLLDWTLDLFFPPDIVQLRLTRSLAQLVEPESDGHRRADEARGGATVQKQRSPASAGGPTEDKQP